VKIIPKKLKFLLFMPARGAKKVYKTNRFLGQEALRRTHNHKGEK
jgi:hypothetical protein